MTMKGRSSTNTFIDTIIRKFDQQSRNYCLVNPHVNSKPIIYCNDGFCELTGFSRSEILQKPGWCEFLTGQLTSTIGKQHLREFLSQSEERQIELLCYKKAGTRFICSILVAPVKAENSEVILLLLSFEDITAKQGGRLFGSKVAGFQWPSSLTGAINRVVGRGGRGGTSAANLADITSGSSSALRRPQEGISLLPRDRRSASLTARRQSILFTFGSQSLLQTQQSTERRGLASMLPTPSFGNVGGLLSAAQVAPAGSTETQAGATTSTTGTERIAVSLAAVTGEEGVEGMDAGVEAGGPQLPPHYGRFMNKIVRFKDGFVKRVIRWVSAEGHPDHKLQPGRLPRFTILHYSPFKAIWDWIILIFVLYTAIFTPYSAAFLLQNETGSKVNTEDADIASPTSSFEVFKVIEFIVDVMFLLDIFINFRTTYVNKADEVITAPSKIAIHYLKGMFLIDAVAAIPFDLLLFGSKTDETTTLVGLLKTVRLIRLVRVARKWKKVSEYGAAVLILLMATFTLIAHWMACIWYAIASVERPYLIEPKIGWLDDLARQTKQYYLVNDTSSGPTLKSKYITALMFTFSSLTSVGFGNIAPNTTSEKIFAIVIMLIGSMMYATIFGNVSAIIQRLYSGTARYHMEMGKVKEFIKFHQIPHPLRQRLEEYFQHAWRYTNGIDMNVVLRSFPECLQADICLHLNRNLLNHGPAFKKASPGCLRQLSMKFRSSHVPPGDILVHRGDVLDALYFISRGSVEIIRDNIVLAILGKDDIFGEDPCRYKYVGKSSANVRALTYCDLHKIFRDDLLDTLEMYPEFAESFAKNLQITFNLRDEHLAVIHGPSSESNTSSGDDNSGHGSPGGDKLDGLPAIRIRRRRLRGSRRRRSSVRDAPLSATTPFLTASERNKAAELRPLVRQPKAEDDATESDVSGIVHHAGAHKQLLDVGGGIFEMRPDKAGLDVTPANFDFPGRRQAESTSITGAISTWAGRKPHHHVIAHPHVITTGDEQETPLLSQQQKPGGHTSTTSSSSARSSVSKSRSPPHAPAPPPPTATNQGDGLRTQTSWQYAEHQVTVVDRTSSGPPGVLTDFLSATIQGRSAIVISSSGAGMTSSATLPDFGSRAEDGTGATFRSTPADERALIMMNDTGMRLTAMSNRHEQRIAVISERLAQMETRLANDLVGVLSMLRHNQQQQARPSISTLTLTPSADGAARPPVVASAVLASSVTLPRISSSAEQGISASGVASGVQPSGMPTKRLSLKHGDSSESPSDSQPQWPPPPSTEEASLNLSVNLSSDDTTSLPSGTTSESGSSLSPLSPDDGPVSFI